MTVLQLCTAVGALRRHDVVCATLCVHVGPALKVRTPRAALRKRRVRDRVGPPLRTLQLLVVAPLYAHDIVATVSKSFKIILVRPCMFNPRPWP